ncbi:hypothetical protein BFU36_07765 [Sulfolobus sp. A20]|uniref:GIY-YIG nuclease family protein n=1 Tax=Saccharolobus sp. A20 TaxID=1891280 RepID=UPI0008461716|nr:DUF123 domain-containing protein [Sulfolobus sp. A20]TRM76271.1 DUF123 domain-containing protein [Sulfolobus sp. A20-N-F8]TRM79893.1 DUF123 domain-containing protein [Sulfolobus sp. F3]TRM82187.1 DUF123 domain-containing protein [Sulfolobus sp. D5]TRM82647.1 DUF123 domain-containing protein [Sulfolobus sp. A20-N-F6]TRM88679.1 DUF123 domain-containing protein [Sulfolobus sp. E3]TRM89670.1 DUF123 domain-containing protein [Sulfolobus sp. C3]TRM92511.1 DUF123 domain-containing protein [Sulfo
MKRSYVVFFECEDGKIKVKSGREFEIDKGIYAYVGSCGRYCDKRISRHLTIEKKKLHWHVDYLSYLCEPLGVIVLQKGEKEIASTLSSIFSSIKDFGSTDDKVNRSHLFKVEIDKAIKVLLKNTY